MTHLASSGRHLRPRPATDRLCVCSPASKASRQTSCPRTGTVRGISRNKCAAPSPPSLSLISAEFEDVPPKASAERERAKLEISFPDSDYSGSPQLRYCHLACARDISNGDEFRLPLCACCLQPWRQLLRDQHAPREARRFGDKAEKRALCNIEYFVDAPCEIGIEPGKSCTCFPHLV
jgi:hypothetical protein